MKNMNDRQRTYMLMTVPVLILFFLFNTLPLIKGVIYSFTNFRGYGTYSFVGLRNYIDLFSDGRVGNSYIFTIKMALVTTVVVNVLSLVLALGLNSKIRFKSTLRGLYFVPNILGALVVGYIFNYFFTYIVPALISMTGGQGTSILASEKWAWVAIVIVCAWQAVAMNTIIYISGLQTVPEDVYEAGSIDGATGWSQFKHLTFQHQHGAVREKLPDGVRPDHGTDKGRSGTEHGIDLLSDLQQRHVGRTVRLPERERGAVLCDHSHFLRHTADNYG